MLLGHAVVRVMKQSACEMRIFAAMDGSARSDGAAEQVRADRDADGGSGGFGDGARDAVIAPSLDESHKPAVD